VHAQSKGLRAVVPDSYTTDAGAMKFIYGYTKSETGEVRYGWAALDGLDVSSGCPAR